MPSVFPGMDPYLERPERWPDVHDSLITHIRGLLQPLLKPKYVAVGQERVYVAESRRLVRPDVAVVRRRSDMGAGGTAVAVLAPDSPVVFAIEDEDVREPFIQIVDPADSSQVVTAIEVLSPKNKRAGPGRLSYLQKRRELWHAGANLVEIDLLRAGRPTARISRTALDDLPPFNYVVVVSRQRPARHEVYTTNVRQRLPRVAIPLGKNDRDVTLDLQSAFNRAWDEGPYPELLEYDGPPPGRMNDKDAAWCERLVREKRSK